MGARGPSVLVPLGPGAPGGLQRQIYAGLQRAILEGTLRPGSRVPSSRELAADLGVSRTTTLLALDQLLAEGYLVARRGSGTYVAEGLPDDLPHVAAAREPGRPKHPPLSKRGRTLIALPPPARREPGPPRPFRLGAPALDLFPFRLWSRLATRRLAAATAAQLDYSAAAGLPALREAIAEHVRAARGTRCEAEQVHVFAGAQRGLDLIARLLLDPGDAAAVEEPGYPGAWTTLSSAGAHIVPVPVDDDGLDVDALARRGRKVRLVYVTPSHQFPLGVPMSLARRLALLRWARSARAWIVEDDYDSEFRHGTTPIPCLQGLDPEGRVIYLGSFSKAVFPALRLGFLVVPPDLQDRLLAVRWRLVELVPYLEQAVLADFIREGHFARHLRRMRGLYRERREALAAAAKRACAGALELRPGRTGLHAVADLRGARATVVFEEARTRGVEVMPVSAYSYDRTRRAPNALVLGFGAVPPEALERGMDTLAAAIEAAGRSKGAARRRPR